MSLAARHASIAVAGIVFVSACVRFAASLSFHAPWVAPDEMAYGLLGESLWHAGRLSIRGTEIGYYSLLYPALTGGPLSLGSTATGIVVLQAVQAVVMSLVAIPVFLWGRRLAGAGLGLVAAALSVLLPALAYSGLIMSEAAFYPAAAVALLLLARAVREPTLFHLGTLLAAVTLAASIRLQALVLLPAFLLALLLDAVLARDTRSLSRRGAAVLALLAAGVVAALIWRAAGGDVSGSSLLGAYEVTGSRTPAVSDLLEQIVWSSGGLVLFSCAVPFVATAVLVLRALIGGEPDPEVRAFVATTVAYVGLLVLQVAAFAATFVHYVPERYLLTALPLLFLGLCTWIGRGAPRPAGVLVAVAVGVVALAAVLPPARLLVAVGAHDLLTTLGLRELTGTSPDALRAAVVGVAVAAVVAIAVVPRRRAILLAAATAAGLAALSVGSSREISALSRLEEVKAFGGANREWIEQAAPAARVMLLNTGDREWPILPRLQFWNANVTTLARLPQAPGSGAIPQEVVDPGEDGLLHTGNRKTLTNSLVVAPTTVSFVGEKVVEVPPTPIAGGLALWRVAPPVRLASTIVGLQPNGDFAGPVYVTVYSCARGRLELTLLGKSGGPIALRSNGIPRQVVAPPSGGLWQGSIGTPPNLDGRGICVFELSPRGLAGSTRIAFVRDNA